MSVSRRVVLSVGILMLLALGVLGYQLSIVVRMQGINDDLSDVSFVAAQRLRQLEQYADELESFSERYVSRGESTRGQFDEALNDRVKEFDVRYEEVRQGLRSWEAP